MNDGDVNAADTFMREGAAMMAGAAKRKRRRFMA